MTTTALTTYDFTFNTNAVRVVTIEGLPWFVANETAAPLGFTTENVKYHLKTNIDASERRVEVLPTVGRGLQPHTLISESGLYKLALRAQRKNPQARAFQDWVTREVLPVIRKTGEYVMPGRRKSILPPNQLAGVSANLLTPTDRHASPVRSSSNTPRLKV